MNVVAFCPFVAQFNMKAFLQNLRLPYSLSGVFSYQLLTLLIRVGYPQAYISMEGL